MTNSTDKIKLIIINIILMIYIFITLWFSDELFIYFWILYFIPVIIIPILYVYMLIKSIRLVKEKIKIFLNWIPLLILIFIVVVCIFFNPIDLRNQYEFKKYFDDRNYIINQIQNDFESGNIFMLDEEYKNLSCSGKVNIFLSNEKERLIGFCYSLSITDGGSYFIYSSDGQELIKKNIKFIEKIEFKDKNWYYVQLK